MKSLVVILSFSFLSSSVMGQETKSTVWFQQDSSRFIQLVDFEIGSPGGVGYNFFYRPWNKVSIGARIGISTRKSGVDIVPEESRRTWFLTYNLFTDYRLWKTNFVEIGIGYYDAWAWPTDTNTEVEDFPIHSSGFFEVRAGLKTCLFNKVMIRVASKYQYDVIPDKWLFSPAFSLGYKF